MKSSDMLQQLHEAHQSGVPIPASTLEFFAAQGNFAVREEIYHLIGIRSSVSGQLLKKFRFDFLLAHLRESFGRIGDFEFTENIGVFLYEIKNYNLDAEKRHYYLQQFIDLAQELYTCAPEKRTFFAVTVTEALVRYFPEVTDRRKYHYSDEFAAWVQESYSVYFPRG